MCQIGDGIKNHSLPSILYVDDTAISQEIMDMLDAVNARYETADARREGFPEPVLVVDGSLLGIQEVRGILQQI